MLLELRHFADSEYLWGASLADKHLLVAWDGLKKAARTTPECTHVILDFAGIAASNVSYIKGTFLWLLQNGIAHARSSAPPPLPGTTQPPACLNIVPFVANTNSEVLAEIDEVLGRHGLPYLVAQTWTPDSVTTASVHGPLDETMFRTLLYVVTLRQATASLLHEAHPDEGISVTGWNNRLADLFALRLLSRTRSGRSLIYRSVAKEIHHG